MFGHIRDDDGHSVTDTGIISANRLLHTVLHVLSDPRTRDVYYIILNPYAINGIHVYTTHSEQF